MGAFVTYLHAAARKPLWVEYTQYAGGLLANGAVPWMDTAAYIAWRRKAQGLLKSDVVGLPLTPFTEVWLDSYPALRAAMAAKSRATFPLKTLLSDEKLRAHLVELVQGLRAALPDAPLVLALPSPRAWVGLAFEQAHGQATTASDDEADSASVFIADFLRIFGESGVDALLLQERPEFTPASGHEFDCYQSVFNVAAFFRWDIGLQFANADRYSGDLPKGCSFAIAPKLSVEKPADFLPVVDAWPEMAHPGAAFQFVEIPADAQPEAVLERLAALR